MALQDITGREVKSGSRIAYPVRSGSEMHMETARVEGIVGVGTPGVTVHCRKPDGKSVRITNPSRIVLIPEGTPR